MFDIKQLGSIIKQISEEKGISETRVLETIESAIAAAYKKDFGKKGQIIRTKFDIEKGVVKAWQIKYVIEGVDEEGYVIGPVFKDEEDKKAVAKPETGEQINEDEIKIKYSPEKHILLQEAKDIDSKLKIGDEYVVQLEEKDDFGRIAAQTAKQVIIQRLREAERDSIHDEYRSKEGELVSGLVQRREGGTVYMDIGRVVGVLLPNEQIFNDNYSINNRLRVLILRVEETNKGPAILLSRSHPKLVLKLFESEVPEISAGAVEVRGIAREAGSRSKIAVVSTQERVDPIGSLVGQKGVRVQTVINELAGEKIDIIQWDESPIKFITNAMSPAKILDLKIVDEDSRHALVEVADDQFSLAIGKGGQNVRLAAKLTGWKIDVRSPKEEIKAEETQAEPEIEEEKKAE